MPTLARPAVADIDMLYARHHGWLHGWLRKRLGCTHDAADLAHDTYLRVLLSGRHPAPDEARPHLMQIAKGLVVDQHRRRVLEQAYLDALAHRPEAAAPSPEQQALALETLTRIDAALGRVPSCVVDTFMLSQFDGFTYSSIATRQGIAVATVRKYMLKAMQACFDALADDPPAERSGAARHTAAA